jgi:NDP-sugar pyrophosphorylase family protein
MKAMILAAGMGTRLKPITDNKPKALVELNGAPMLDIVLNRLIRAGFSEIIINVHHFAGLVIKHLEQLSFPGTRIEISDESGQLLDTGGAIMKAKWFLDGKEAFLVHNTDVISTIDLPDMIKVHQERNSLATLAVSERSSSRYFLLDKRLLLRGWENVSTNERILTACAPKDLKKLAFSGIHVISPEIFRHITQTGRFSIIQTYLHLCSAFPVHGYMHQPGSWFDLGKREDLEKAEEFLRNHPDGIHQ